LPQEPSGFDDLDGEAAGRLRSRTAIHEAAHAVASLQVQARPRIRLEIARRPDGLFSFGGTTYEGVSAPVDPRLALDHARDRAYVGLFGPTAEARWCRQNHVVFYPWDLALSGDELALDVHARRIAGGSHLSYRNALHRRVAAELDRSSVWDCVLRIAAKLQSAWPLEEARNGGPGRYVGELSSSVVTSIAKSAGLPGRRR
jgi:hypothetical protein